MTLNRQEYFQLKFVIGIFYDLSRYQIHSHTKELRPTLMMNNKYMLLSHTYSVTRNESLQ